MGDEADEQQPELRELQEELFRLRELQRNPGYKYLLEIAEAQLETRKQAVFLNPLKSMDEVLEQEYKKGEIQGITLFTQIVETRAKDLEDTILELTTNEVEKDNERRNEQSDNEHFEQFFTDAGN